MDPDKQPSEDDLTDLLAAAQSSNEQAAAMLNMATALWQLRQALAATGFPPDEALALTLEYFRRLWEGIAAASAAARSASE